MTLCDRGKHGARLGKTYRAICSHIRPLEALREVGEGGRLYGRADVGRLRGLLRLDSRVLESNQMKQRVRHIQLKQGFVSEPC